MSNFYLLYLEKQEETSRFVSIGFYPILFRGKLAKSCNRCGIKPVCAAGNTINFYLSQKRDLKSAKKFLLECIKFHGKPEKITIDKSGANIAAVDSINNNLKNKDKIEKRTSKYLNNRIEQDHRQIKQKCKQVLGFKSFKSAEITLYGVEIVHALIKEQKKSRVNCILNAFQEFKKLIA